MSILGDWDVTIKTPIGSLAVVYAFADDGGIAGTATARARRCRCGTLSLTDNGLRGGSR